jgi:hypothetical protein
MRHSGRDITVSFYTGMLWWKRKHTRTFRGSGTRWRDIETGRAPEEEYGLLGYDIIEEIMRLEWLRRERGDV